MSLIPPTPKIYHITHVDNLSGILSNMELVSDAKRINSKLHCSLVGMSAIKERRLKEIQVSCHQGTTVGQYVPFYLCPRSIMLFILHKGNHPDLDYRGGQEPIIHLQGDMKKVIHWANQNKVKWSFTNCNAGAFYARFFKNYSELDQIDWTAIESRYFGSPETKEKKQAEFLMFDVFPWTLIEKIGTINANVANKVRSSLKSAKYKPDVVVERSWYF